MAASSAVTHIPLFIPAYVCEPLRLYYNQVTFRWRNFTYDVNCNVKKKPAQFWISFLPTYVTMYTVSSYIITKRGYVQSYAIAKSRPCKISSTLNNIFELILYKQQHPFVAAQSSFFIHEGESSFAMIFERQVVNLHLYQ